MQTTKKTYAYYYFFFFNLRLTMLTILKNVEVIKISCAWPQIVKTKIQTIVKINEYMVKILANIHPQDCDTTACELSRRYAITKKMRKYTRIKTNGILCCPFISDRYTL